MIFRVHKNNNYTTIDNNIFKNKNLSYKSTGLLCMMLSLPDDWNFSINGLAELKKDKESIVRTAIKELRDNNYLKIRSVRNDKGKIIDWEYNIYEKPVVEKPHVEKPHVEKPHVEKPHVENQPQLNTNIIKELNNKILNNKTTTTTINNIYSYIEENFNRTLTPIEFEVINEWEDNELTRYAIKQAVLNSKYSIKYINSIINSYKTKNITSVQQAQEDEANYKKQKNIKYKSQSQIEREAMERFMNGELDD